jgi:hypothetical protein
VEEKVVVWGRIIEVAGGDNHGAILLIWTLKFVLGLRLMNVHV